jgi:hypothetical protein
MGYLNNNQITVDAILTRRGRELLARGRNEFQITHFALADDEIDYSLFDDNANSSELMDRAIINTPIFEPILNETEVMKYKLVTLDEGSTFIPVISIGNPIFPSGGHFLSVCVILYLYYFMRHLTIIYRA